MPKKHILFIQQVSNEGPGCLLAACDAAHLPHTTLHPYKGDSLKSRVPEDYCAIVILGGPMNVYATDQHPFLKDEIDWIKRCLDSQIPLLGICLGAQLLCVASGGKVKRASSAEHGWTDIELNTAVPDPVFKGLLSTLRVLQIHDDACHLPRQAVLLAQNSVCTQAFRVGERAWGIQFHFEADRPMIADWFKNHTVLAATLKEYDEGGSQIHFLCNDVFNRLVRTNPQFSKQT